MRLDFANRPPADLADLPGREDVLARLQEALRGEHALIVQIMSHGYRLRDGATLCAMEGIGRQDMRHFKWLAEMVVRLGGTPTLERDPVELAPAAPHVWLAGDVALVETRLARYAEHLDALPAEHVEVRELFERIVADKVHHRLKLVALVERWQARHGAGEDVPDEPTEIADEATKGFLEFAIGHEYEVILQYLHHGFLLEDQYASRMLEDVAIEEMRHLGWLSEMLIERGGCPVWKAERLELDNDAVRMLELDQARELEVEADYAQMTAALSDPEIRALFDRIGDHERYHAGVIGRLIDRLKARQAPGTTPVVAALSAPTPAPEAPARPKCPYTVGSLFGQSQT